MVESSAALKIAKNCLKKQDGKSMKLKALAKVMDKELGDDDNISSKTLKKWIQESSKFELDGKMVSLAGKKRSKDSSAGAAAAGAGAVATTDDEVVTKKPKLVEDDGSSTASSSINKDKDSVAAWRKKNKIVVKHATEDSDLTKELQAEAKYFPYTSFSVKECKEAIVPALLNQCTQGNGFTEPSPIQAQSWPILMAHVEKPRDVVGIAETGSGKTLAFGLPALSKMYTEMQSSSNNNKMKQRRKPRMLVLSPTRELAMQSDAVLQEFGAVVGLKSLTLYGGVPKYTQVAELKKGQVDCLVATPGRLKDLIQEGNCDLSQVTNLVLDEADRMLDMGFEEDVRYIISQCKSKDEGRQTAMFSATWPAAIQQIAGEYMNDPVRIYVGFEAIVGSNGEGTIDDSLSANKRVTQIVEVVEDRARESALRRLLKQHQSGKKSNDRILVFALYKKEAERLEFQLRRDGHSVCSIHGNKQQVARTAALEEFKSGKCPLMVATDVAARGLDIPNVELVINYTFPLTIEDYVHRIGRTGRAGKMGISHTFFQPGDKSHAGELQQVMKQAGQEVPEELMKFGSTIKKKEHKLYGNFGPRGGGPMKKATKITFDHDD